MADQNSFEDQFNNTISFTTSDIDAESPISQLKIALESANPTFEIEEWQQLLEKSWSTCKRELLEENFFSLILPMVHSLLCRILKQIDILLTNTTVSNILNNIKDKLLNCEGILDFYQKSVEYVSSFGKVSIEYVKSLPDILPSSIKLVFEHCKTSSHIYGTIFKDLSKELMSLFRKASGILKIFLTILEDVIIFDVNIESEMASLLNVIKLLGAIAASSHGLDLKTFVGTTTSFAKLAITYCSDIKTTSPENVITSFQQITKETNILYSTILDPNSKNEERTLKGASIILNIITKLTSAYCKYLSNDILFTLVELLLHLHRYTAFLMDSIAVDMLNNNISSGTTLLLNILLKNSNFNQIYFQYRLKEDVDKLGFHLLTLAILKAINNIPYDKYCNWILETQSVLDIMFTNFDYLQEELCVGELQLSSNYNFEEKAGPIDLYAATLVSICKFIISMPCENFHIVEKILLKNLLSGIFWNSLLSSDVWYCIGRYSSPYLCSSHVKYLMHTYAILVERRNSLEVCVLKNLISRLYTLLPENEKHSVIFELDDIDACLWLPFSRLLPYKTRTIICERLAFSVTNISNLIDNFLQQPSARHWFQLTKLIPAASKFCNITEKEMIDVISKLWNFITNIIEGCDYRYSFILSDFSINVLDGTQHDFFYHDSILNAIANLSLHALPHAKIKIAYYIEDLAMTFKNAQPKVINGFAELNCRLLEDENPWVSQEMLESFDRLAHTCPNEELVAKVANAISRKLTICDSVPAYLSYTQYYKLQDILNVKSYLLCLIKESMNDNTKHICVVFQDSKKDVKIPRIESEKMKYENMSKELNERVNKICNELESIIKRKSDINDATLRNLRAVLTMLTE
ncbi:uncharacterized protein C1orf112-like isoform X2 [Vespa velutina]|uniref:uncharacterized protein C1orf112-like isoform X2 n=1 Tax=Vespa velutina TaxID=202808 RepID=UPI001FB481C5|nr:uncharacterized protein C1orf112-like isoform X2 [Vespa velutina]